VDRAAGAAPQSPAATARSTLRTDFTAQVVARMRELTVGLPEPVRALTDRHGKFLRSTLVQVCATVGEPNPGRLVRLGALVELVHLASLVHDDVVDRADRRRDGPTAHVVMGEEQAMLGGLSCFAIAGKEAADLGGGLDVAVSRTVAALAYGEILDVERAFDTTLPLADYVELIERKTGDLFHLCCAVGAAEAGADEDAVRALGRFGVDFGVAFQILDDCLDFDAVSSGKPIGTDHLLGLFGAPTLYALAGDPSGALAEILLDPLFHAGRMPEVHDLVVARGGLAAATRLAEERRDQAWRRLDGLDTALRDALLDVTSAVWTARA
jgi:geranylgeranyl pyrophosphate synthase